MPRPYLLRIILKVLKSNGFFFVSQTGSHAKYRKGGAQSLVVIVPIHGKEVRYGTFKSILRQSRLKEDNFRKEK